MAHEASTSNPINREALERHYASFHTTAGHRAICRLLLPETSEVEGKRALDLDCRKGKGVLGLCDKIGETGHVIGVDASADNLAIAAEYATKRHWAHEDWPRYLQFVQGYKEDLDAAGIESESVDVVFVNSSLNVSYDLEKTLAEIYRVLANNGGFLHVMGIFSRNPIDKQMRRDMAASGNVFGAALTMEEFESLTQAIGFMNCNFSQVAEVELGEEERLPSLEGLQFVEAVAQVRK